jgi:hypothetical protein
VVEEKLVQVQPERENHYTPLHRAAYGGKREIVEFFVKRKYCKADCKGVKGRTPLHSACRGGKKDIVEYLIRECGAELSSRDDNGNTPLHSAALSGDQSVVALLITDFDCDPNITNDKLRDPADVAKDMGHDSIVRYLQNSKQCGQNELRTTLEKRLAVTKAIPTGEVIASGKFSSIIELKIASTGERVVGKVFKTSPYEVKELLAKVDIITKKVQNIATLDHHNIIKSKDN